MTDTAQRVGHDYSVSRQGRSGEIEGADVCQSPRVEVIALANAGPTLRCRRRVGIPMAAPTRLNKRCLV